MIRFSCRKNVDEACEAADPARQIVHGYSDGLLSSVSDPAMYASAITYHPNGMLKSVTHGEGSQRVFETWTADAAGMSRPSRITATNTAGAELWSTGNYAYDGAGNIKSMGHARYWYDAFQRLVDSTTITPLGKSTMTAYGYDSYGNRLYETSRTCNAINDRIVCGSPTYVARSVTGTTNHYGDATYDATGNVTSDLRRTFSYDPVGMMTRAQIESGGQGEIRDFHYLYTADDERIAVVERINAKNKTTWSVRDFDNRVLRLWTDDKTSGTRVIAWKEDPIYRGSALLANVSPTGTKHYSLDHLGSPRLVTEVTGVVKGLQSFSDYGAGGTSDGGALQYTGHERDIATFGSGTADLPDYFHARYYDFGTGRFLSVDPKEQREPLSLPQGWNRYAYTQNNPLKYVDPDGEETKLAVGGRTDRNPVGHVAIIINDSVYSFGTNWSGRGANQQDWGASAQVYLDSQAGHRQTDLLTLNITPEQEQKLQQHLDANNPNAPGAPKYNELSNSCTTVTQDALVRTGTMPAVVMGPITPRGSGPVSTGPAILPALVGANATNSGIVSSTQTVGKEPKVSWVRTVINAVKEYF